MINSNKIYASIRAESIKNVYQIFNAQVKLICMEARLMVTADAASYCQKHSNISVKRKNLLKRIFYFFIFHMQYFIFF